MSKILPSKQFYFQLDSSQHFHATSPCFCFAKMHVLYEVFLFLFLQCLFSVPCLTWSQLGLAGVFSLSSLWRQGLPLQLFAMKMMCFVIIMLCLDSAVGMKAHSAHSLKMFESNGSDVSFLGHQEAQVAKSGANVETNMSRSGNTKIPNFVGCPSEFPTLVLGMGYRGDTCIGKSKSIICPLGCYQYSSKCLKAGTRSLCDVDNPRMCRAPFVVLYNWGATSLDKASECHLSAMYRVTSEYQVAPKGCLAMRDYAHSSFAVQSNQFDSPFMLVQLTSQKCLGAAWSRRGRRVGPLVSFPAQEDGVSSATACENKFKYSWKIWCKSYPYY